MIPMTINLTKEVEKSIDNVTDKILEIVKQIKIRT